MYTAKHDDRRIGFGRLSREAQRVTHVVRQVLNLRHLVIVREDHGVEILLELENLPGKHVKLLRRGPPLHAETGGGARLDLGHVDHGRNGTAIAGPGQPGLASIGQAGIFP